MSDPLTPVQVHETLDENGWLDDSQGSGCYALEVETPPDDPRAVFEDWTAHHDTAPQWLIDGLADAGRLAYIGAASDVYGRIMDHAKGDVRRTAVMRCYPPVDVLGVEAAAEPFQREYNFCQEWVEKGWVCWMDGTLHGR